MPTRMSPAPLGLRERKKAATRAAIADAALRLCVRSGFDEVTVEAIAHEADVSPRTFFNYFPSKEAAVLAPSAARWEQITRSLAERDADEGAWTALRAVLVAAFAAAADRREWVDALLLARSSGTVMAQQRNDYVRDERQLVDQVRARLGADAADLRPHVVVASAVTAVRVAVQGWLDDPEGRELADLLDQAMDLIAGGMLAATADGGHA